MHLFISCIIQLFPAQGNRSDVKLTGFSKHPIGEFKYNVWCVLFDKE